MFGLEQLLTFLERGGVVLFFIMAASFFMLALVLEREFYFRIAHKDIADGALEEWQSRSDKSSLSASWIREKLVSEVREKVRANIIFAKFFVALAPLLGLLGTVTGMIDVFDYMAITQGSDVQAMARGVSRATIPTMAGMVTSIVGIILTSGMDRRANRLVQKLEDQMENH